MHTLYAYYYHTTLVHSTLLEYAYRHTPQVCILANMHDTNTSRLENRESRIENRESRIENLQYDTPPALNGLKARIYTPRVVESKIYTHVSSNFLISSAYSSNGVLTIYLFFTFYTQLSIILRSNC